MQGARRSHSRISPVSIPLGFPGGKSNGPPIQTGAVQRFPEGATLPSGISGQADPGEIPQPRDTYCHFFSVWGAIPKVSLLLFSARPRLSYPTRRRFLLVPRKSALARFLLVQSPRLPPLPLPGGIVGVQPIPVWMVSLPLWGVGMLPLLRTFSGRLTLWLVFRLSVDFQG